MHMVVKLYIYLHMGLTGNARTSAECCVMLHAMNTMVYGQHHLTIMVIVAIVLTDNLLRPADASVHQ